MKRTFPEIADEPYVILLLVVIFSGGECPKEIDIYSSEDMVNGDSQAQSGEMKNVADNSAYERGVKQLLGEDIISNDSLLRHFYAANPVTRTKRKIQKFSSNEGLSNGPEKGSDIGLSYGLGEGESIQLDEFHEDNVVSYAESIKEDESSQISA